MASGERNWKPTATQGEIFMTRTPAILRAVAGLGVAALAITLAGCAPAADTAADSGYVTEGKLTIGTGLPAYYPWVIDDTPETGEGFEAAIAYAVAEELGFAKEDVVWVRTTFDEAIAPGPKNFDFNLQQFTITDERKQNVDFSSAYYETTQAVITIETSKAASATSLADLKPLLIGAASGTTSFDAIEQQIAPTAGAQAFNSNDDAKLALGGAVDAIVVDLPTAFYLTGVELTGGLIVGQLPVADGKTGDEFGLVLAKDSPLTATVTAAVDALRTKGTLAEIAAKWLADNAAAPVLK
jgi:polar amino acid transport system substrate-binding protein